MEFAPVKPIQLKEVIFDNADSEPAVAAAYLFQFAIPIMRHFAQDPALKDHRERFLRQSEQYWNNVPKPPELNQMDIEAVPALLRSISRDCLEYFFRRDWDHRGEYLQLADYCDFFARAFELSPVKPVYWNDYMLYLQSDVCASKPYTRTPETKPGRTRKLLAVAIGATLLLMLILSR